jgi:hypothetical protein
MTQCPRFLLLPILLLTLQAAAQTVICNELPVVAAGANKTITLPTNTVNLSGSATDIDGSVSTYKWTKVTGPAAGTITTSTRAATAITGLTQGTYVFRLAATDDDGGVGTDDLQVIVNAATGNTPPVASAGGDQTITQPQSSVTLNGIASDADGTIAGIEWTQVSGPAATITPTTATVTTVSGLLTVGTYAFRLTVVDNAGSTDSDTTIVTVVAAPEPTLPKRKILHKTGGRELYYPNGVPASALTPAEAPVPGDTLIVPAGSYDLVELGGICGTRALPIVIQNATGGAVETLGMRFGVSQVTCFIKVEGIYNHGHLGFRTRTLSVTYGHHFEITGCEMGRGGENGLFIHINPDANNPNSFYHGANSFVARKFYIHHNIIHDTKSEGMYIGHTYPNGDPFNRDSTGNPMTPVEMDSVEIAFNDVRYTGWDGIQLSNAGSGCSIHDNTVKYFGMANASSQQAGIIFGSNTRGKSGLAVYRNWIEHGTGEGIQVFGYGINSVSDNTLVDIGYDYAQGQEALFGKGTIDSQRLTQAHLQLRFDDNVIVRPHPDFFRGLTTVDNSLLTTDSMAIRRNQVLFLGGEPTDWASHSNSLFFKYWRSSVPATLSGNAATTTIGVRPNTTITIGNGPAGLLPMLQRKQISGQKHTPIHHRKAKGHRKRFPLPAHLKHIKHK